MKLQVNKVNDVSWRNMTVKSNLPESLSKLEELSQNIWWAWNSRCKKLFREIDKESWIKAESNPVQLLNILSYEKLVALGNDKTFIKKLDTVYDEFQTYMNEPAKKDRPSIAYFSMEYGLTEILKIYSGGLGVLAGDYLKEASDSNVDMTAVGFLYRYGYFKQSLSMDGQQISVYEPQNFNILPLKQILDSNSQPVVLEVPYPGRIVYAHLWKVAVGRISLILLDTDLEQNSEYDRQITHQLYGGDWENRMKQEVLLGIGGILALKKLNITKQVYHCNEGHAALINIQRLVDLIADEKLTFNQALEVVRASSLYTVHTPVPAGHDSFDESLFSKYLYEYAEKLQISWQDLINMGRTNPDTNEKFNMSVFACNTSQEVNGVSWLHGEVSKEMFSGIWKGYFPEESHVSYVTNGVHMPTWTSSKWKTFYEENFAKEFYQDQSNEEIWKKIHDIPDKTIWEIRTSLKNQLIDYIRIQFRENWLKNQGDPSRIVSILDSINPNALIIGFGRRFATYKRAHLLFKDLERLEKIVNNTERPIQFLYTGKAHPADGAGQGLIKRIIEISRLPQFVGKIIFLENYDMRLAKRLISGVDIWLNTPTRPQEASGTSGEKALMNGVLNFSVLDGWWYEGYREKAGWAITDKRTYENQAHQDELDAVTLYNTLENEILPLYYAKDETKGYSPEWIQYIKNSIAQIAPNYTTKRMMDDYFDRFYLKLSNRSALLRENNFEKAKEITQWKEAIAENWDNIEVVEINMPDKMIHNPQAGEKYSIDIVIDLHNGNEKGIGIELVTLGTDQNNQDKLIATKELSLTKAEGSRLHFSINYQLDNAGVFKYGFRMFPKNDLLPHRQDFSFVKWL